MVPRPPHRGRGGRGPPIGVIDGSAFRARTCRHTVGAAATWLQADKTAGVSMAVTSVLVSSASCSGCEAAIALARLGVEVTLLERASAWPDDEAEPTMRDLGIEPRLGTELVGFVPVDRHVEAELSDGRIENYDVVVVAGDASPVAERRAWRVIASGAASGSDAVAAVNAVLATLADQR
ncbi:FAD-dependent oxidoreductase [Microbacterium sp. B2969]|uniref:FAD-dependent oxidoreductase n=1 Tax=Microbacterium alkaliflavum TaxID=3248839 RepID=A0ABW7Q940_9MICO